MTLKKTIFLLLAASTVLTTAVCLLSMHRLVDTQTSTALRENMRSMMDAAENARQASAQLRRQNSFDDAKLISEAKQHASFRDSALYRTVPVVAAWNSISSLAQRQGYEFRVPAHNARDKRNEPTEEESAVLSWLSSNRGSDYFVEDSSRQQVVYARAVTLSEDCLVCHGNPALSKSGDGRDPLGFPMENWKAGDIHGAFILRGSTAGFAATKRKAMLESAAILLLAALLIGFALQFFWRRVQSKLAEAVAGIRDQSDGRSHMVSAVSSEANSLAQTSSHQTASVEETSAAMEEIRGVAQQNRQAATDAAKSIGACRDDAGAAEASLRNLAGAMSEIQDSTGRIAKIIRLMDEIAFQTNILALNAAVEAARAGQAGLGFSVVADEVRNLAHRSTQAAKEIQGIIEDSVGRARNADQVSQSVSQSIRKMNQEIFALARIVEHVEGASNEQARGIDEMSNALHSITNLTTTVTSAAESGRDHAEQLSRQAHGLRHAASELEILLR